MSISNYIPNSRISQSGVCTSTTRPASPYEGQVIFETDTNRVLVYDSSAWVMIADTDAPPGLQLIKTSTFTNQPNVQIDNCFINDFKRYRIVFSLNGTGTSLVYAHFRLSANGTPSTTGYYAKSVWWSMSTSGATTSDSDTRTDRFSIGPNGGSGSQPMMTVADIYNPNDNSHTSMTMNGSGAYYGSYFSFYIGGGAHTVNSSYDGINFFPTGGNVTGSISIYGYRD